jgi:hypothetical protein
MVATRRPFGVSFAAGWAAISAFLTLLTAMGAGVVGIGGAGIAPGVALMALALAVFQLLLGFAMLVLAGGLYRMQSWARLAGIVLFGASGTLNAISLVDGDVAAVVSLGLNGTALTLLVLNRDAFVTDRPDLSEGTASSYRPGR